MSHPALSHPASPLSVWLSVALPPPNTVSFSVRRLAWCRDRKDWDADLKYFSVMIDLCTAEAVQESQVNFLLTFAPASRGLRRAMAAFCPQEPDVDRLLLLLQTTLPLRPHSLKWATR